MQSLLKLFALLSLFILVLNSLPNEKNQRFSKSFMVSRSFSSMSSLNGNKPDSHFRSMSTEEYREKDGDKPEEVRKYGEMVKKDNSDPAILKRNASTNIEGEEAILGGDQSAEQTLLDTFNEKRFLRGFGDSNIGFSKLEDGFKNFFNFGFNGNEDPFSFGGNDNSNANESKKTYKHGKYDRFLEEKGNKLIAKKSKNK
jgi:hypothetical protein